MDIEDQMALRESAKRKQQHFDNSLIEESKDEPVSFPSDQLPD